MFDDETKNQLTKELVVERYKFIQEKQIFLDSMLHKNITFVVKLLVALFSLVIGGLSLYKNKPELLSQESFAVLVQLASLLCCFVSVIFLLMSLSNIVSWFGYRDDEVKLLNFIGGSFRRDAPKKRNFYTWQETWFIFSLIVLIVSSFAFFINSADFSLYIIQ